MKDRLKNWITTGTGVIFILLAVYFAVHGYLKYEDVKIVLVIILSAWGVLLVLLKDPEWLKTVFDKLLAKQ